MNSMGNKPGFGSNGLARSALVCACWVAASGYAQAPTPARLPATTTPLKQSHMVAPALEHYTQDLLLGEIWTRPHLAPRDRSMVTVSALVASGQVAQITYHLNRAMDNGLTEKEAGEMLTQRAFYAGWPNVFSAMPVFKEVFANRAGSMAK